MNLARGKRILIVDHQEAVLIFLKDRLEKLGFVVSLALSGKEGKRLLQEHSFHGVLLDLEMPVHGWVSDVARTSKTIRDGSRDYHVRRPHSNDHEQSDRSRSHRLPDEAYFFCHIKIQMPPTLYLTLWKAFHFLDQYAKYQKPLRSWENVSYTPRS